MAVDYENGLSLARQTMESLPKLEARNWHVNGSVAITGVGNDVDVVVLQDRAIEFENFEWLCDEAGFLLCGEESYESAGMFLAYRKGDVNLIIVENAEYYRGWAKAAEVCRKLSRLHPLLNTREYRVMLFEIIADGNYAEPQ